MKAYAAAADSMTIIPTTFWVTSPLGGRAKPHHSVESHITSWRRLKRLRSHLPKSDQKIEKHHVHVDTRCAMAGRLDGSSGTRLDWGEYSRRPAIMPYPVLSTVKDLLKECSHLQTKATSKDTGLCRKSRFAGPLWLGAGCA